MLALLPTFDDILNYLTQYGYYALILMLLAAGMGVPIPEDIPLILSGYMTNPDHPVGGPGSYVPSLILMCAAGMFGVLAGDSVVFFIGRHGINSNNFVARHVQKVMTPKRLAWAEKHFAKHGNLTVFAGRFMPGFRAVVFAMAGASRMSYIRFIIVNGLAALVSVPLWVILGHYLAAWVPRDRLESKIEEYKHIILPILGGIALLVAIYLFIRWRRNKKLKATALAAAEGRPALPESPAPEPTVQSAATEVPSDKNPAVEAAAVLVSIAGGDTKKIVADVEEFKRCCQRATLATHPDRDPAKLEWWHKLQEAEAVLKKHHGV